MAQQQHAVDVHPDEPCPPNKLYDLMDANKKVELEHVQCPIRDQRIEKLVEDPENVDDSSPPRHDDTSIPPREGEREECMKNSGFFTIPSPTRSPRNLSTLVSSDTEKLQELTVTHPTPSSCSSEPKLTKQLVKIFCLRNKRSGRILHDDSYIPRGRIVQKGRKLSRVIKNKMIEFGISGLFLYASDDDEFQQSK
ncbi:hypothetical protein Tco_0954721 [Tanacetum coccineum]|uniref:Uncharacterized protein n=1 Tax=Tanacetum coccineum TaxID=301880 RepID=A0ABQ5E569_9ASTR